MSGPYPSAGPAPSPRGPSPASAQQQQQGNREMMAMMNQHARWKQMQRMQQAQAMAAAGNQQKQQQGGGGAMPPPYAMSRRQSSGSLERRGDASSQRGGGGGASAAQRQQQQMMMMMMQGGGRDGPPQPLSPRGRDMTTRAQNHAMAMRLARSRSGGGGGGGRPPQQQQQMPVPRPRKQRVITPEMVRPRPIESKGNIMMRSKHAGKKGGKSSNDSVSDSVNTDATEQVQNNRAANARRKRDKMYAPALETVNTLESKTTFEDLAAAGVQDENGGDVRNAAGGAAKRALVGGSGSGTSGSSSGGGDGTGSSRKGASLQILEPARKAPAPAPRPQQPAPPARKAPAARQEQKQQQQRAAPPPPARKASEAKQQAAPLPATKSAAPSDSDGMGSRKGASLRILEPAKKAQPPPAKKAAAAPAKKPTVPASPASKSSGSGSVGKPKPVTNAGAKKAVVAASPDPASAKKGAAQQQQQQPGTNTGSKPVAPASASASASAKELPATAAPRPAPPASAAGGAPSGPTKTEPPAAPVGLRGGEKKDQPPVAAPSAASAPQRLANAPAQKAGPAAAAGSSASVSSASRKQPPVGAPAAAGKKQAAAPAALPPSSAGKAAQAPAAAGEQPASSYGFMSFFSNMMSTTSPAPTPTRVETKASSSTSKEVAQAEDKLAVKAKVNDADDASEKLAVKVGDAGESIPASNEPKPVVAARTLVADTSATADDVSEKKSSLPPAVASSKGPAPIAAAPSTPSSKQPSHTPDSPSLGFMSFFSNMMTPTKEEVMKSEAENASAKKAGETVEKLSKLDAAETDNVEPKPRGQSNGARDGNSSSKTANANSEDETKATSEAEKEDEVKVKSPFKKVVANVATVVKPVTNVVGKSGKSASIDQSREGRDTSNDENGIGKTGPNEVKPVTSIKKAMASVTSASKPKGSNSLGNSSKQKSSDQSHASTSSSNSKKSSNGSTSGSGMGFAKKMLKKKPAFGKKSSLITVAEIPLTGNDGNEAKSAATKDAPRPRPATAAPVAEEKIKRSPSLKHDKWNRTRSDLTKDDSLVTEGEITLADPDDDDSVGSKSKMHRWAKRAPSLKWDRTRSDLTKESLVTEGEITLAEPSSLTLNKTRSNLTREDSLITEGDITLVTCKDEDNNASDGKEKEVGSLKEKAMAPTASKIMSIATELFSPAKPSSLLSPVNKEDVEIQLPASKPEPAPTTQKVSVPTQENAPAPAPAQQNIEATPLTKSDASASNQAPVSKTEQRSTETPLSVPSPKMQEPGVSEYQSAAPSVGAMPSATPLDMSEEKEEGSRKKKNFSLPWPIKSRNLSTEPSQKTAPAAATISETVASAVATAQKKAEVVPVASSPDQVPAPVQSPMKAEVAPVAKSEAAASNSPPVSKAPKREKEPALMEKPLSAPWPKLQGSRTPENQPSSAVSALSTSRAAIPEKKEMVAEKISGKEALEARGVKKQTPNDLLSPSNHLKPPTAPRVAEDVASAEAASSKRKPFSLPWTSKNDREDSDPSPQHEAKPVAQLTKGREKREHESKKKREETILLLGTSSVQGSVAEDENARHKRGTKNTEVAKDYASRAARREVVPITQLPEVKPRAPHKSAIDIDSRFGLKLDQSNSRVGQLKKELLLLSRPGLEEGKGCATPTLPTRTETDRDGARDSNEGSEEEVISNTTSSPSEVASQSGDAKASTPNQNNATSALKLTVKSTRKKKNGTTKKALPKMKSFLGKKSKIIEEEREYAVNEEVEDENERGEEDCLIEENATYENEEDEDEQEEVLPSLKPPRSSEKRRALAKRYDDESSSDMSIEMKSTLSGAEFSSVQSSVTTDQAAFNFRPGVFKRTASLVRNPALALRNRTRSHAKEEEEEFMKRMKHARTVARQDNRKKEEFDIDGNSIKYDVDDCVPDHDHAAALPDEVVHDDTIEETTLDQNDTIEDTLVHDDTIEDTIAHDNTIEDTLVEEADDIVVDEVQEQNMEMPYNDLAYDADSMYEDNDIMINTTVTFEDTATRQQRREMVQQQQQVRFQGHGIDIETQTQMDELLAAAIPPVRSVSSGGDRVLISRTVSRETATQTSVDQYIDEPEDNDANHGLGSFGHVMESLGLFGASVCMGSSKAMLGCVDSCGDNPQGVKKASRRLSSINSDLSDRLASPRNGMSSVPTSLPTTPKAADADQEATGIFTRALAMALQATMGGGGGEDPLSPMTVPRQQPQTQQIQVPAASKQQPSDFMSIDGYFVSPNKQNRQIKKRVPRNIALKAKKPQKHELIEEQNEQEDEGDAEVDMIDEAPELKRTDSLKRVGSAGKAAKKKGIGKFFKKIPRVKFGVMYEV